MRSLLVRKYIEKGFKNAICATSMNVRIVAEDITQGLLQPVRFGFKDSKLMRDPAMFS
jgi:hypothetical protein